MKKLDDLICKSRRRCRVACKEYDQVIIVKDTVSICVYGIYEYGICDILRHTHHCTVGIVPVERAVFQCVVRLHVIGCTCLIGIHIDDQDTYFLNSHRHPVCDHICGSGLMHRRLRLSGSPVVVGLFTAAVSHFDIVIEGPGIDEIQILQFKPETVGYGQFK